MIKAFSKELFCSYITGLLFNSQIKLNYTSMASSGFELSTNWLNIKTNIKTNSKISFGIRDKHARRYGTELNTDCSSENFDDIKNMTVKQTYKISKIEDIKTILQNN